MAEVEPMQYPNRGINSPEESGLYPGNNSPKQSRYPDRNHAEQYLHQQTDQLKSSSYTPESNTESLSWNAVSYSLSRDTDALPSLTSTVPDQLPYSQEEWNTLVSAPLKVCMAMVVMSPSSPLGMIQEVMAIGRTVQMLQQQRMITPLVARVGQQIVWNLESIYTGGPNPLGDMQEASRYPAMARSLALNACYQIAALLDKVSSLDASAYKRFVYTFAYVVAEAGHSGGFPGIRGNIQISETELSFLADISSTIGLLYA